MPRPTHRAGNRCTPRRRSDSGLCLGPRRTPAAKARDSRWGGHGGQDSVAVHGRHSGLRVVTGFVDVGVRVDPTGVVLSSATPPMTSMPPISILLPSEHQASPRSSVRSCGQLLKVFGWDPRGPGVRRFDDVVIYRDDVLPWFGHGVRLLSTLITGARNQPDRARTPHPWSAWRTRPSRSGRRGTVIRSAGDRRRARARIDHVSSAMTWSARSSPVACSTARSCADQPAGASPSTSACTSAEARPALRASSTWGSQ